MIKNEIEAVKSEELKLHFVLVALLGEHPNKVEIFEKIEQMRKCAANIGLLDVFEILTEISEETETEAFEAYNRIKY
jgi:hypothetical protein